MKSKVYNINEKYNITCSESLIDETKYNCMYMTINNYRLQNGTPLAQLPA